MSVEDLWSEVYDDLNSLGVFTKGYEDVPTIQRVDENVSRLERLKIIEIKALLAVAQQISRVCEAIDEMNINVSVNSD